MPCYGNDFGYKWRVDWKALRKKYTDKGLSEDKADRCAKKYARNKGWYR